LNILVIEDHPTELKLTNHVLESSGHDVNGLDAAERAFDAIRLKKPDLILLDMQLPGMNGLELARLLRVDPSTSDILIVAVTSHPERFSKPAALEAGCDAYLVKPLSTRTLPRDLDQLVAARDRSPIA